MLLTELRLTNQILLPISNSTPNRNGRLEVAGVYAKKGEFAGEDAGDISTAGNISANVFARAVTIP